MTLTRTIDSPLIFSDEEAQAYYDLLTTVPDGSTVLEIGLQYGRSSSVALQVARNRSLTYYGIDPFTETPQAEVEWLNLRDQINYPVWLLKYRSDEVRNWPPSVALALIDGDHTTEGVTTDCKLVMPLIASSGYICLHDYDRSHLPGVKWGAEATLGQSAEWKLERVTGTLAIWRKA
jgi:cephalosporin hydroxylase